MFVIYGTGQLSHPTFACIAAFRCYHFMMCRVILCFQLCNFDYTTQASLESLLIHFQGSGCLEFRGKFLKLYRIRSKMVKMQKNVK